MVDERRVRALNHKEYNGGPVVYVMGRDFRAENNWALVYAQHIARERKVPLSVLVHFGKNFIQTNERQHSFFIDGLKEVSEDLEALNIPFFVTYGSWKTEVKQFVKVHGIGAIVTDFSPLHEMRWWWDEVSDTMDIPVYEVDAHNLVPCWVASEKQEFAAHTFRRKLHRLYPEFRGKIPAVKKHPYEWGVDEIACWPRGVDKTGCVCLDWHGIKTFCKYESTVVPVREFQGGPKAGAKMLATFIAKKLDSYADFRNDPNAHVISNLSPYIRFGFISTQYIIDEVERARGKSEAAKQAFIEEVFVRKELAENFCFYQDNYNNFEGIPHWAKVTLAAHRNDPREYTYTFDEFETAKTHDPLWNAAQTEMVTHGKMHGYMRMYWAKKILEWSNTPEEAIETAIVLNDRYSLDGRDPNGYVGILWSIGGVHDRAWAERPVYGKIRYMNYNGCKRKFDIDAYIAYTNTL